MPEIVKWKYIDPLRTKLAELRGRKLTDAECVKAMNAAVPTGEVEVVEKAATEEDLIEAIGAAKDFAELKTRLTTTTEEVPVMGPSWARQMGIGRVYEDNLRQLDAYEEKRLTDEQIQSDLDARKASTVVSE